MRNSKQNITFFIFGLLIFLVILIFPISGNAIKTSASNSSLAIKDSYVDSYNPTSNYGGQDWLIFGDYILGPTEAYIGFDTASPPSGWTKAEIEIDMYSISETTQLTISLITESWAELSITWINKPAYGQEITKLSVATEQIYKIDVTNFVSGNSLSICINATTFPTGYVQANSREGHTGGIFTGPTLTWTYPTPSIEIPGFNLIILIGLTVGLSIYLIYKKLK